MSRGNISRQAPKGNIYWRDVPASACVIDRGHYFEVKIGRKRAVVNWDSRTAGEAQRVLARRARKGCR